MATLQQPAPGRGWADRWGVALLLFLAGAFASNIPLFGLNAIYCSEDFYTYYQWTGDFTASVLEGAGVPRWSMSNLDGLGAPAFLYVSPAFFYLASLFRAAGVAVWLSMRLAVFAVAWALGVSVWRGLKRYVPARWALLGGLIAQFNPMQFHVVNLHNLFPFYCAALPLTWFFFATLNERRPGLDLAVVVSLALLVLTHQLVAFMALLALPFLFLPGLAGKEPGAWGRAVGWGFSCVLGLMLAGFYLYPALTSLHYVKAAWFEPQHIDWRSSFIVPVFSSRAHGMRWAGVQWGLGGLAVLAALVLLLGSRSAVVAPGPGRKLLRGGAWAGIVAVFMASDASYPLWAVVQPLHMIEWPYRFLVLILPVCAAALVPLAAQDRSRRWRWAALAVLGLYPALAVALQVKNMPVSSAPDNRAAGFVNRNLHVAGSGEGWKAYREAGGLEAECRAKGVTLDAARGGAHFYAWTLTAGGEGAVVRLPLLAFPAWVVKVNGESVAHGTDEGTGLMAVRLPPGRNEIDLQWRSLPQERIGWAVSGLALVLVAPGLARRRREGGREA